MSYPIQVLCLDDVEQLVVVPIRTLNNAQRVFHFSLPNNRERDVLTRVERECEIELESGHVRAVKRAVHRYRTLARGHIPFAIAVVDMPLHSDKLGNLFGTQTAAEGVAMFTLRDAEAITGNVIRYVTYYLARYATTFAARDLKNHEETRTCLLDKKIRKLDINKSIRKPRFCDECEQHLENAVSDDDLTALHKMLAALGTRDGDEGDSAPNDATPSLVESVQKEADAEPHPKVDIAVVTIIPEEYRSVVRRLEDGAPIPPRADRPNTYAWFAGFISRKNGAGRYRVIVAMAGEPGNVNASHATHQTAVVWQPECVVLSGIAGGFSECKKGDVVVSNVIYAYEYGKIRSGSAGGESRFDPRHDYTYRCDTSLCRSATAFGALQPHWGKDVIDGQADGPRLHVGPVASGEKIVDDPSYAFFASVRASYPRIRAVEMEGAGAAAAIERLGDDGILAARFIMVRGISDLPRADNDAARGDIPNAERDDWKSVAADAAAAFLCAWISHSWPFVPRTT